MKVNVSSGNLFISNYQLANNESKMPSDVSSVSISEFDVSPIKVTISEEGKKAYKNNFQDMEKTNYESMVADRRELLEQKNQPEIHYGFMFGNKLAELTEINKEYRSIEDRGAALLGAYASIYDEIVQGYADGTREIYAEDKEIESGYRKMTMEEEIAGLDIAYEKYVSGFEARIHQSVNASKAFDKYMAKISKLDVHRAEMATKAKEIFDNMSEEDMPENISESMLGAKQKFLDLYLKNNRQGLSLREMIGNIKIFS